MPERNSLPDETTLTREQLVGTWRLVSYETHTADRVRHPFGPHPQGYLIYTADGMMSTAIMRASPWPAPAHDEIADPRRVRAWLSWRRLRRLLQYVVATTHYVSYCGRYDVVGDTVIHHVEVSLLPGWRYSDQERTVSVSDGRLLVWAHIGGAQQHLVWERVETGAAMRDRRPMDDL